MISAHKVHRAILAPRPLRAISLLLVVLSLLLTACEKDATTLVSEGTIAYQQKKFDQAIKSFEDALKLDPKSFDATIGLAEVYMGRGDFSKSHEHFDKARALKPSKAREQFMNQLYQDLLLREAQAMKDKKSPEFEKALRGVVEINKRSAKANEAYTLLGEYYMTHGDELAKAKDTRQKAVDMYLQMLTIRTQPALRKEAKQKAKKLQRDLYADAFAANIAKSKPEWDKEKLYDPATTRLKMVILKEDKEINPKEDEEKEAIRKQLQQAMLQNLLALEYKLAGIDMPPLAEIPVKLAGLKSLKVEEEIIEKGKVGLTHSVELKEIEELTYKVLVVPARKAKKKPKKGKKGKDGKDAKKAPATPASAPAKDGAKPTDAKKEDAGKDPKNGEKKDDKKEAPKKDDKKDAKKK